MARADVVDAGRVEVVVSLSAALDVLVDGGEEGVGRSSTLTLRERHWTGAGSAVSRRTESVLGRVTSRRRGRWWRGEPPAASRRPRTPGEW